MLRIIWQPTAAGHTWQGRQDQSTVAVNIRWIVLAVVSLLLLLLPQLLPVRSTITIMNQMAITIVFAMSYNMLLGQAGLLSFGHAIYMGLGGIFCLHLMNFIQYDGWWIPLPLLPLFGGLFSLIIAMLFGSFSTRRAGSTFAMITLGLCELVIASTVVIGVFFAASGDRTYAPAIFGYDFSTQHEVYYLVTGWMLFSVAVLYYLTRTPLGRMINAVRDNPERAEFVGYSQWLLRYLAFCIGGFFAGVAGGLFAINFEIITGENLDLAASGEILMVTVLGGTGFFFGPIIGAIVFTLMQTVLSLYTELWRLYLGILFVAMTMYFPGGLTGLIALHAAPLRCGGLHRLFLPYCRLLFPSIIAVAAIVALLELTYRQRFITTSENIVTWMGLQLSGVSVTVFLMALAIAAIWIAARQTGQVAAAWQAACDSPFDPAIGIHRQQRWHVE
jgi:branched-chain amino acid transport system permease protein